MRLGNVTPAINGNGLAAPLHNVLNETAPRRFFIKPTRTTNMLLPNIPYERPTLLNEEIVNYQAIEPTFFNGYRNGESKFSGVSGVAGYVAQPFYGTTVMVADVRDVMTQLEQSWEIARGNGTGYADKDLQLNPDLAYSRLIGITVDHCNINPVACQGFDIPGIASELAGKYGAWFDRTFPKGWGDAYNYDAATFAQKFPGADRAAEWMYPEGGTATTPVVMGTRDTTPAPGAVDYNAVYRNLNNPTPVTVTPQPQVQTQQYQTTAVGNQGTGANELTQMIKDNWPILALAAGALVLIPMLGNRS